MIYAEYCSGRTEYPISLWCHWSPYHSTLSILNCVHRVDPPVCINIVVWEIRQRYITILLPYIYHTRICVFGKCSIYVSTCIKANECLLSYKYYIVQFIEVEIYCFPTTSTFGRGAEGESEEDVVLLTRGLSLDVSGSLWAWCTRTVFDEDCVGSFAAVINPQFT